jgi:hypothetical protein
MILDRVNPARALPSPSLLDSVQAYFGRVRALWTGATEPAGRPAYWEGFTAYQDGRELGDNPHRAGSPKAEAWLLGWHKGLED